MTGPASPAGRARRRRRTVGVVLAESAAVAALALAALVPLAGLAGRDLSLPFEYRGDANFYGMLAKGMIEGASPLVNPRLGAPFSQELYDLPQGGENLQFLEMWVVGRITGDWAATVNLVYVLGFPAVALSAYWVSRRLRFGRGPALVVALCFAFLPFHFVRGPSHLLLAGYWTVPLGVLVLVRLLGTDRGLLRPPGGDRSWWRPSFDGRALAAALVACAVIGSASTYYAGFTAALVGVTAVLAAVARRDARLVLAGALVAGAIGAAVLLNNAPSLLVWARDGVNEAATERGRAGTELYGLRVTQLLLPTTGHRIGPLGELGDLGTEKAGVPSEVGGALGVVGVAGFAVALFEVLGRPLAGGGRARRPPPPRGGATGLRPAGPAAPDPRPPRRDELRAVLGELVVVALLLGLIGGFAFLLALGGFTFIRAWNRISVFVAFASLLVVATLLEQAVARLGRPGRPRWAPAAVLAAVAVVGVLDGTPRRPLPPASAVEPSFESDRALVREVEAALPPGAAVFQLPVHPFPEGGPRAGMADYDHLRGYLHADDLRWSYGGMKGREADWQQALAGRPTDEVLDALAATGFDAVWLDRAGYEDGGAAVEAELRARLGAPLAESRDGRIVVFDLRPWTAAATARLGEAGLARRRDEALSAR